MFTAIYRFDVHPGRDADLEESWAELTRWIRANRGSLGSRLCRDTDGRYVAIALWPDRATYDAPSPEAPPEVVSARTRMREACRQIETLHQLELVTDLWV